MQVSLEDVRRALTLSGFDVAAAQQRMMPTFRRNLRPPTRPGAPRLGGVLVLLYTHRQALHLLLTRRRPDLNAHGGQISFPGGQREGDESFQTTALRETHEEVGVPPQALTILGRLSQLYILPSDFEVHPFVAYHRNGRRPRFHPDGGEVAELLEVPLSHLLDPANRQEEPWQIRGLDMQVPFFAFQGHKIWGATAMMLSEFLERLRTAAVAG